MFGSSTADGIQFQFRAIKQDANTLKATVNSGGNPASVLSLGPGSTASTPRGPRATAGSFTSAASTPTTASKRSASTISRSGASSTKRTKLAAAAAAAAAPGPPPQQPPPRPRARTTKMTYSALPATTPSASTRPKPACTTASWPRAARSPPPPPPPPPSPLPQRPHPRPTRHQRAAPASQEGVKFDYDAAPQGYGPGAGGVVAGGAFCQTGMDGYFGASSEGDSFGGVDFGSFVGSENYDEI
ncbi:predicted protein [Verticillium alfalfae VaMs.102]|uniref:Predicted protein n=1 Tax=Verticillium alfalfae (strain VaMs.102 / ATCC MYA-4576 / FGSC 10136) TaxID=526221 RepID=C9S8T8_VERA1|nr:predicted protein [Verticillium alfalfae VaMs.102]EEY14015.1 predicted protein [Verticillium alfalfae VaMs.102]